MFGRAALFLVLGTSTIFMMYQQTLIFSSNNAVDTYASYYVRTNAQNLAISAANMACNEMFISPTWTSNLTNIPFNGGTYSVTVIDLGNNKRKIRAVSSFQSLKDTVEVVLSPSNFARFAYYAAQIPGNLYYATGDTFNGPVHVQGTLNVVGSPVFWGKTTTEKGLKIGPGGATPKFNGGYEAGVSLAMPTNIDATVLAATSGGKVFSNKDIWLTFNTDGTVNYKEGSAGVWQNNVSLTALAPNKVIAVDKGNLHVKGIVSGKVTIAATQSSGMGNGNIYIDDDITYKNSPASLSCPDMLGIVASNNVIISDLPANKGDVTIHGTMFCNKGGLSVENYNKIGYCGAIRLTGGLIESQSQATGVWSGSSVTSGYNERFTYDPRFMIDGPPAFPATGSYEILSWLE